MRGSPGRQQPGQRIAAQHAAHVAHVEAGRRGRAAVLLMLRCREPCKVGTARYQEPKLPAQEEANAHNGSQAHCKQGSGSSRMTVLWGRLHDDDVPARTHRFLTEL